MEEECPARGWEKGERADSGTRELLFRGFDPSVNFQAGAR